MLKLPIMHTKLTKASNLLIIFATLLVFGFSRTFVFAEDETTSSDSSDPYVIALIYVEEGCTSCDDLKSQLNALIGELNAVFDFRDVDTDLAEGELDVVETTCGITNTIPMAVFEDECLTESDDIIAKSQVVIDALTETENSNTTTDTDTTDDTETTEPTGQTLEDYLNSSNNDTREAMEINPWIMLAILVIPAAFVYGIYYLIKKFSL